MCRISRYYTGIHIRPNLAPSLFLIGQEKLQLQNMRLGPPPLVVPIKRQEDLGGSSEDDGLPHSPSETCQDVTAPRGGSYKVSLKYSSL